MTDLSPAAIVDAAVANHRSWSRTRAGLTGGATVERAGGQISVLRGTTFGGDEVEVLFAEPSDDEVPELVDEIEHLAEPPAGEPPLVRSVGWWSASDDHQATLGPRLLARGFQWGWAPHWMGLDLDAAAEGHLAEQFPPSTGVHIRQVDRGDDLDWSAPDLPYHEAGDIPLLHRLAQLRPPTVTLAAVDGEPGGKVLGKIVVHLASDDPGNAGIYSCGVVPGHRGRGIGAALTAAAADLAAALDCRVLTLNATAMGEPVYRRVGMVSGGWGRTWWLTQVQLTTPRPSAAVVTLVEAIGVGDIELLDSTLEPIAADRGLDLDARLRCGLTPLGVAVQFGQGEAAQLLVDRGASLDVLSAWDLGWRDRVPLLLRDHPDLVDRRTGELGATPLQHAIDRDDGDLVEVLLAAGPDLSIRDRRFDSDALGWAEHLDRPHLAERIRSHRAS